MAKIYKLSDLDYFEFLICKVQEALVAIGIYYKSEQGIALDWSSMDHVMDVVRVPVVLCRGNTVESWMNIFYLVIALSLKVN